MKFFNYVFIMIGIMVIFNAAGYTPPVGGMVKTLVINNDSGECKEPPCTVLTNIQSSTWVSKLILALKAAAVVGIVAGIVFNLPSINYLIAGGLSLFLGLFLIDLVWLYGKMIEHGDTWLVFLMTAIFAPLIIGFIVTAIEWWRGSD